MADEKIPREVEAVFGARPCTKNVVVTVRALETVSHASERVVAVPENATEGEMMRLCERLYDVLDEDDFEHEQTYHDWEHGTHSWADASGTKTYRVSVRANVYFDVDAKTDQEARDAAINVIRESRGYVDGQSVDIEGGRGARLYVDEDLSVEIEDVDEPEDRQ